MPHSEPPQSAATLSRFVWRRLLQYRLRTLLIVTTVVAAGLGRWSHKARQQREAVEWVQRIGGGVNYDYELDDLHDPPHTPKWLVEVLGVEYFANVKVISLAGRGRQVTDLELKHLEGLKALELLNLSGTCVTGAGLEHLNASTTVDALSLRFSEVTDAGLKYLKALNLLTLDLRNTKVTDAGVEHLKNLTTLQEVWLDNTQVTDAGGGEERPHGHGLCTGASAACRQEFQV